jgi:hypothetical protein
VAVVTAPPPAHAAGHVEQLAYVDPIAVGQDAGQPALDRVRKRELVLADELQRDGRDERLRVAAGTEAIGRTQRTPAAVVGNTGGVQPDPVTVVDERDHAGGAGVDDAPQIRRQRWACGGRGGSRDGRTGRRGLSR